MVKMLTSYTDSDGNSCWADATAGDDLYYSIDFGTWLTGEADTLVSVAWNLPDGITSSDDFLAGNVASIKLATPTAGNYEVSCTLSSIDAGKTQTKQQYMRLTVY